MCGAQWNFLASDGHPGRTVYREVLDKCGVKVAITAILDMVINHGNS